MEISKLMKNEKRFRYYLILKYFDDIYKNIDYRCVPQIFKFYFCKKCDHLLSGKCLLIKLYDDTSRSLRSKRYYLRKKNKKYISSLVQKKFCYDISSEILNFI